MYFNAKRFFKMMDGRKIDVIGFGVSNSELVFKLAENPTAIDGRIYSLQVRPELKELYCHKIDILGSAGKAGISPFEDD